MGKIAKFKRGLLDFIKLGLAPHEFKQSHQSFSRKVPIGSQILHIAFVTYPDKVIVEADVDIRHDELENFYNALMGEQPAVQTATIGSEIEKLAGVQSFGWVISSSSDIPIVGNEIISAFWNIGCFFLEKYSDPKELFEVLASDDLPARAFCIIDHVRAEKALIAAVLLARTDLDNLIDKKIDYLTTLGNPYLADFLEFVVRIKRALRLL
jgi:hypothetical protein